MKFKTSFTRVLYRFLEFQPASKLKFRFLLYASFGSYRQLLLTKRVTALRQHDLSISRQLVMSKPTRFRYWEHPLYVAKLRKPITFYSSKRFFFGESPPLARYPFNGKLFC